MTEEERELITMLAEECAEVVQVCTKILRHGLDSYHPKRPSGPSNRHELAREIEDVLTIAHRLKKNHVLLYASHDASHEQRFNAKRRWMHHQRPG